jgi:hypothetical protein
MPAIVSGTMAAVGPINEPTSRRVKGISRIIRMMNGIERPMFTSTSSRRLMASPSTRLPNGLASRPPASVVTSSTPAARPKITVSRRLTPTV